MRPENIPGLSNRSHTFWYDDPWVSSDVLITLLYHLPPDERGLACRQGIVLRRSLLDVHARLSRAAVEGDGRGCGRRGRSCRKKRRIDGERDPERWRRCQATK